MSHNGDWFSEVCHCLIDRNLPFQVMGGYEPGLEGVQVISVPSNTRAQEYIWAMQELTVKHRPQ